MTGSTGRIGYNPAFLQADRPAHPGGGPFRCRPAGGEFLPVQPRRPLARDGDDAQPGRADLEPVQILAEEAVRFFLLQSNCAAAVRWALPGYAEADFRRWASLFVDGAVLGRG